MLFLKIHLSHLKQLINYLARQVYFLNIQISF